jgi:hypothetical protein
VAVYIVSTDRPSVEGAKSKPIDQLTWARMVLQLHHLNQTVRRWGVVGGRVCLSHCTIEHWTSPHGCRARLRGLTTFLTLASPAQIEAAVLAGDISRDESEHGVCVPEAGRHERRPRRQKANRPGRGPVESIPAPLERVDIS